MISKVLFTIFAVIAIWKAFSFLARLNQGTGTSPARSEPPGQPAKQQNVDPSIDLIPCRRCGAYVDPKEGCRCTTSNT